MCGRFSLTTAPEAMRQLFEFENFPNLEPRYNIAPTQMVACIRADEADKRQLEFLRWGLIPSWSKDAAMGAKMINARAETVAEKPSFREAFANRRCLIAADGFYEWRQEEGRKQPFRIGMKGGVPFAFAGLWERWTAVVDGAGIAAGETVESVTIVTTTANDNLRPIHARMPVILPPEAYAPWLDAANDREGLFSLLGPYPVEPMAFYRVGSAVSNARNDGPDCIAPLKSAVAGGG
jgi:putative SOS response-associated peptidase YedK